MNWLLGKQEPTVDPLQAKMEVYLKNNVQNNRLKVTAQNPIPCLSLCTAFAYIPQDVVIILKFVTPNGYYCKLIFEEAYKSNPYEGYVRIPGVRIDRMETLQAWPLEITEEMQSSLVANTLSLARKEDNLVQVKEYKTKHQTIDFDQLQIDLHGFCRQFPVIRNETTPAPVVQYNFLGNQQQDSLAWYQTNQAVYKERLETFYTQEVKISNYTIKATQISFLFSNEFLIRVTVQFEFVYCNGHSS